MIFVLEKGMCYIFQVIIESFYYKKL